MRRGERRGALTLVHPSMAAKEYPNSTNAATLQRAG